MTLEVAFDPYAPDLHRLPWVEVTDLAQAVGGTVHGDGGSVRGAVIDNRAVLGGELFVAMPGFHVHGAKFAADAASRGAGAVLSDPEGMAFLTDLDIPAIIVPDVASVAGQAAAIAFNRPCQQLSAWGVTGTNGKTTTTYLLRHLLHRVGHLSSLVGTVEAAVGKKTAPAFITTPQAPQLQAFAATTVQENVHHMVVEVSSHALAMGRVDPLHFACVGFTNLSQDHLDYHGTMEQYFQTKASLFSQQRSDRQVIIVDGVWGQRLAEQLERSGQHDFVTLSLTGRPADWQGKIIELDGGFTELRLRAFDGKEASVQVRMPGTFNAINAALAIVMVVTGLSPSPRQLDGDILRHLTVNPIRLDVPGRMELLCEEPRVIVDFAHNPDSTKVLLDTMRISTKGRLLLVMGADGQRDPGKRPILGQIAAELADFTYVTDGDIHEEEPSGIRRDVMAGMKGYEEKFVEVAPREVAIERAILDAHPEDTVVITGRGHESIMFTPEGQYDLDDRVVAREALSKRN
ncbi:Mur ligase family protein [Mobiluncus curtisii]|uniref:Mur ligase family protein n=1 Tax=Mobiluncus curtisii TaxID=2051 RepID=UPI00146FE122|nr:UDP-N-acetylmuramoyl-L-alanyl-D-glutamate--2,6-diaminopimelate ligase [Mobiluncus curtisii]NMW46005.1 UDP-N-acetylmuramoyl-L-alanyl-D-glutamate--2,6-diaminopimelate ligase [Mobiluncus curtisii]NMW83625.1 UDP-N-acetylmuramoyl-L-alanyl-D-glutamate--2,6-diaminopimelate ligase [Mobiluncus curtisii]NMW99588.1 UDP-N-acetylmuramoyl-L-alanyl-D-glutamate--2,6-diaminopimelate ligase [Mobiluncus curtisii]NMX04885.1 UDP-N-acetylmuramoyl-L-alanyl-D-glutamate--2,6-diaminopimelate ligase [Mobiluncus curtis